MNTDILVRMGLYLAIMIVVLFILNIYTHNFFFKYIKVRASRGKKILIRVVGQISDYPIVGEPVEGSLKFKDRTKADKILQLPQGAVSKFLGINWVMVNEELNAVYLPDLKGVSGFDAIRYNNLYLRALYKPPTLDNKQKLMFFGIIAIILGLVLVYIKLGDISSSITALKTVSAGAL